MNLAAPAANTRLGNSRRSACGTSRSMTTDPTSIGAPVANATVSYKIFREDYHHAYFGPGEYDWLYGQGYGRYHYPYPWLPWWGRWGGFICREGWWLGHTLTTQDGGSPGVITATTQTRGAVVPRAAPAKP